MMMSIKSFAPPLAATALAIAGFVLPSIASAQDIPSYAQPNGDQTIHGRIASVNGTFNISVRDDGGYLDNVELHQGTIINPTGLTLATGMTVTIAGIPNGGEFDATEIDTPYQYDGPLPVPYYYGPGWWYPGYAYGYGPSFGLTLFFGGGGWGFEHRGFYGRPFAYNGRGFVPSGGFVGVRAPLAGGRVTEPVGRATQGAWRSFATSRAGYTAPASRGYAGGAARGYAGSTARGYAGSTARGYAGSTARGYAPSYAGGAARSYSAGARGYSAGARGYSAGAARSSAGARGAARSGSASRGGGSHGRH
jgi:hypothetical protein